MVTPDPTIEALRRALHGRKGIRLALLFGSRARGRARPESDADITSRAGAAPKAPPRTGLRIVDFDRIAAAADDYDGDRLAILSTDG
jgi:predicted nucleotidyltransferase